MGGNVNVGNLLGSTSWSLNDLGPPPLKRLNYNVIEPSLHMGQAESALELSDDGSPTIKLVTESVYI